MRNYKLVMIAGFLSLAACGEDSSTSGQGTTTLELGLGVAQATDASGATHQFDVLKFHVRHIELNLPGNVTCDSIADQLVGARCEIEDKSNQNDDSNTGSNSKIIVDGPFLVDLNAGTPTRLQDVVIPDLAYSRVDVRITPDSSNLLDGRNSLVMVTNTTLDAQPMNVQLAFSFTEDLRFEAVGGVRVIGGPVLVDFDPSSWFEGMEFDRCVTDAELEVSQLLIDDDSDMCDEFEGVLKENLKKSGQLR